MLIHRPPDIPSSQITDDSPLWNRRDFSRPRAWEDVTGYNNYYEFGTGKDDARQVPSTRAVDPKPAA